jgi:molybdopterin-guanine dinucleotide biosynthesis protein A
VLSCDIPLISSKVINHLIDNSADFPVLVSKYEDKIHPLIGIWDASLIPSIGENLIEDRLKLKDYLNENGAVYTDLKECGIILENTTLMNVNTPDELKRLKNGM